MIKRERKSKQVRENYSIICDRRDSVSQKIDFSGFYFFSIVCWQGLGSPSFYAEQFDSLCLPVVTGT